MGRSGTMLNYFVEFTLSVVEVTRNDYVTPLR